jgi:hypothetical protein
MFNEIQTCWIHENERKRVSFHKAQNQSTSLNERQSLTELRMACTTAGKLGKPMHQLCSLIATHWNPHQRH